MTGPQFKEEQGYLQPHASAKEAGKTIFPSIIARPYMCGVIVIQ